MTKKQNEYGAAAFEEAGAGLAAIGRAIEGHRSLAVDVRGFSIRGPSERGGEVLMVLRGVDADGKPVVSFHSAFTTIDVVRGAAARLDNGSLKWRTDEYAKQ